MNATRTFRILHAYDRYLNIYADRGNIMVLCKRMELRGMRFEVVTIQPGDTFSPDNFDLVYIGGGQDRDQRMIAEAMKKDLAEPLAEFAAQNKPVLAVCGGYQLLGHKYVDVSGSVQPGIGLLDFNTIAAHPRLIGNIVISVDLPARLNNEGGTFLIAGFENHAGRTELGSDLMPFGKVVRGFGNNDEGAWEGVRSNSIIGTYLHGPLLPRNPRLADWLLGVEFQEDLFSGEKALIDRAFSQISTR